MADIFVKVNLPNVDCRNIYFINNDEIFSGKEITKAPTYISRDYKLVLRITYVNQSCVRTQTKKTFDFSQKITFLQALRHVSSQREILLKKLIEGAHKELKITIPTLQQAWDEFVEMKKNQLSALIVISLLSTNATMASVTYYNCIDDKDFAFAGGVNKAGGYSSCKQRKAKN